MSIGVFQICVFGSTQTAYGDASPYHIFLFGVKLRKKKVDVIFGAFEVTSLYV